MARLLPDLSTAEYVTLLGGSKLDCTDCTLDVTRSGRAVIVSESSSVDLPTSPGAFGPTPNGGSDAYVARLSPDGSALEVGTYLGGTGAECTEGCRVAVDRDGSIWIAGNTSSGDFPGVPVSNPGPLGPRDMFLAHLSADGHNLLLSRRYRGRGVDVARDIAVDDAGDVWVALRTSSDDLQTTADAYDPTYNGRGDIAVLEMDGASGDVRYGTYLGGAGLDGGWLPRVELGSQGRVYAAGQTGSSDFPTTAGAFDTSLSGLDGFALVLGELVPSSPTPTPSATVTPTPSLTPSPSETPTPSLTPSPSDTPTPSPSPTATPLPQPPANVCPQILGRVPSAVIAAALANPEMVSGWDDLCNRNRPGDPSNRRRHWLTLLDPGKPYHPLFNSVVYRCGCP